MGKIQSLTSGTYNQRWDSHILGDRPGQWAGQELSKVKCLAHHGSWWAEGEDWYLPKEGLGHRLGLSHSHIVGLGKDWQCEGSNHSNFCSFWRYPVGEMSHKLTKCH